MHRILAVGADSSLLYIRGLVLARSGASVAIAIPEEALPLMKSGDFDLLVLCHSLPQRELQSLTMAARACARPVRTLLLESPGVLSSSPVQVHSRFRLDDGPDRLILAVQALLASLDTVPPASGLRLLPSIPSATPAPRKLVTLDKSAQIRPRNLSITFRKAQK
jgi:CheY-like chemotaxis protein